MIEERFSKEYVNGEKEKKKKLITLLVNDLDFRTLVNDLILYQMTNKILIWISGH